MENQSIVTWELLSLVVNNKQELKQVLDIPKVDNDLINILWNKMENELQFQTGDNDNNNYENEGEQTTYG